MKPQNARYNRPSGNMHLKVESAEGLVFTKNLEVTIRIPYFASAFVLIVLYLNQAEAIKIPGCKAGLSTSNNCVVE